MTTTTQTPPTLTVPVDHQSQQDVMKAKCEVVFDEFDDHRHTACICICICSDRMERTNPADTEIHHLTTNRSRCSSIRSIRVVLKVTVSNGYSLRLNMYMMYG